jgi:hypothetical protein
MQGVELRSIESKAMNFMRISEELCRAEENSMLLSNSNCT